MLIDLNEPPKRYGTVYVDPPWPYNTIGPIGTGGIGTPGKRKRSIISSERKYGAMTVEDLKGLPIEDLVEENAHLYLWVTNSFLVEGHDIARAWGFEPKTLLTWGKIQKGKALPEPAMAMGFYYRSATEHILFCVRGSLRLSGPTRPNLYLLPRLPHSVKPPYFYYLIEEQSPGPYLELFCRRPRPGWDRWGKTNRKIREGVMCEETNLHRRSDDEGGPD